MRLNHIIVALTSMLITTSCQTPQSSDSVVDAKIDSAMGAQEKISTANVNFLIQMTDSRLMNLAAGELAEKKGTTKAIKAYGTKLVTEQDMLIEELRSLAQMNGVTLPQEVSDVKKSDMATLKKLTGKKFDRQFLTLMIRNHEQDVKAFQEVNVSGSHVNDPSIAAYAKNRLPMIEERLMQLNKLHKRK